MQLKSIKVGMLVQTPSGPGKVVRAGGTFPPCVQVEVVWFNGTTQLRSFSPRELKPYVADGSDGSCASMS